jgi:23S rRNA (uracil1939-C5)-methyltransferase
MLLYMVDLIGEGKDTPGMARKKKQLPPLEIQGFGPKGVGVAAVPDLRPVHIPRTMPGDKIQAIINKRKKSHYGAFVQEYLQKSPQRVPPRCSHFGECGGCCWQMVPYGMQLEAKEKEIQALFEKKGLPWEGLAEPILEAPAEYQYRNKLEFSFGANRWIPQAVADTEEMGLERRGLGFYVPGRWDRILDLKECFLGNQLSNQVRNSIKAFALEQGFSFYNQREHTGLLRQLLIRTSLLGQSMVTVVFADREDTQEAVQKTMAFLQAQFPAITSLWYAINSLPRDSYYELDFQHWSGAEIIQERCGDITLDIHPKSFYQTNPAQAERLYGVLAEWAGLTGQETLWDLYCGTGSIGLFLARGAKEVLGVELVAEAVENARENARVNEVENARYFQGTVEETLSEDFQTNNSSPDLVVVDPPRGGLHPKARDSLLKLGAPRILYVSCNPKTQADDLEVLTQGYTITRIQPVDMFPQTYHSENVVLLEKKAW